MSSAVDQSPTACAPLPAAFFARPAEDVARALLGKALIRQTDQGLRSYLVRETEAYIGPHDLACHAARGRTARTDVLYRAPGTLYVYLCYGIHWMLNVVTDREEYPAAVLIRGLDGIDGPGRTGRALGLDGRINGRKAGPESGLWFAESGVDVRPRAISATPRIGIDYAGPVWSKKKLRFFWS